MYEDHKRIEGVFRPAQTLPSEIPAANYHMPFLLPSTTNLFGFHTPWSPIQPQMHLQTDDTYSRGQLHILTQCIRLLTLPSLASASTLVSGYPLIWPSIVASLAPSSMTPCQASFLLYDTQNSQIIFDPPKFLGINLRASIMIVLWIHLPFFPIYHQIQAQIKCAYVYFMISLFLIT